MALSRLIRPLHVGASMMSCIVAQKQRPTSVPLDQTADGYSILETAVGSKSASVRNTRSVLETNLDTNREKREKELISRQACDASGNLYHRFYFQGP